MTDRPTKFDVATFLRLLADLYFANYTLQKDGKLQARGFAFAKAAEAVAAQPQAVSMILNGVPIKGVGESTVELVREYIATGHSRREAALQHSFELPDGLRPLAGLEGLTEPFLFVLSTKYGVKTHDELLAAIPRIRQDNEPVGLRVYSALLREAEQATAERHDLKLDGVTTGRLPTDRENKP